MFGNKQVENINRKYLVLLITRYVGDEITFNEKRILNKMH